MVGPGLVSMCLKAHFLLLTFLAWCSCFGTASSPPTVFRRSDVGVQQLLNLDHIPNGESRTRTIIYIGSSLYGLRPVAVDIGRCYRLLGRDSTSETQCQKRAFRPGINHSHKFFVSSPPMLTLPAHTLTNHIYI
jgi:hypothetical protein